MIHLSITVTRRHLLVAAMALVSLLLLVPVAVNAASGFTDVADDNVFKADIQWLADAGVTKGCNPPTNDKFCPSSNVTREQMAAFMHRLSGGDNRTIDGRLDALEADVKALSGDVSALEASNAALSSQVSALQTSNTTLSSQVSAFESLFAGVERNGDTLLFNGMNIQVVNGTGRTGSDMDPSNGLGNIVIGYNEGANDHSGSHYLVIGQNHTYTRNLGIIVGNNHSATGYNEALIGGESNSSDRTATVVIGGYDNTASAWFSAIVGGHSNTTGRPGGADFAAVFGGNSNSATANDSAVLGGLNNSAEMDISTVVGGQDNAVSMWGNGGSVFGGHGNTATGSGTTVTGGWNNTASGSSSSVSGGENNTASGSWSSILGGDSITVGIDHGTSP